ncbi:hypothetical protein GTY81_05370 [Streptomyces sp. SID8366]|nr:hypothetical protein [Streptomyces sp. SID8366]MYU64883.1 hypothetical protein [Streptomyces sp. SID69]RAJ57247.1 N-acetylglucosamine-6-phosphate deacetylase [Streptomyces sp. PsTaAH-130]TXJ85219.1 hypothetical protein E2C11_04745 [Streptomyces lavendulae]
MANPWSGLPPVEVHCHGFGDVDFSDFTKVDLARLDAWCASEGVLSLPTMYLHREQLAEFETFVHEYHRMRGEGLLPHVAGIALEGPLLASHGGTPAATVWAPSRHEWERLAALGPYGLVYTVLSPDAFSPASELHDEPTARDTGFDWLIPLLMAHGIRPALGHFTRADPLRSAEQVDEIVETAWRSEWSGNGVRVVTDHLFNDMPLLIRHAFRSTRARAERDAVIASYDLPAWTLDQMARIVGPVPAAIMRQAAAGRIGACINFDGEHVDLAIAARAVQLMGVENSMMMTDRCDSARLGGQDLHHRVDNALWYQQDGIVAAGSVPLARQMANAQSQGLSPEDVRTLAAGTAHRVFGLPVRSEARLPVA